MLDKEYQPYPKLTDKKSKYKLGVMNVGKEPAERLDKEGTREPIEWWSQCFPSSVVLVRLRLLGITLPATTKATFLLSTLTNFSWTSGNPLRPFGFLKASCATSWAFTLTFEGKSRYGGPLTCPQCLPFPLTSHASRFSSRLPRITTFALAESHASNCSRPNFPHLVGL